MNRILVGIYLGVSLFSVVSAYAETALTGSSCEKLLEQTRAICEWKKTLEPDFVIPSLSARDCKTVKKGTFSLNVPACLPEFVQKYSSKKLANSGPNCWGTTMNFHGLSKTPRFFWPEEMQYWMESPMCRKLSPGETLLPGDVINVYSPEYLSKEELFAKPDAGALFWQNHFPNRAIKYGMAEGYTGYQWLLHTVTYIAPDLAYGKDSPAKDDLFRFHPMNEVYGRPGSGAVNGADAEDRACQENQSFEPHLRQYAAAPIEVRNTKCPYLSVAYRCGDLSQFVSPKSMTDLQKNRWQNIQSLQAIQEKLFSLVVDPSYRVGASEVARILALADKTTAADEVVLRQPGMDTQTEMLVTLEYFTAAALRKSLEQARLTPATSPL
jgi:hypothetical protein